MASGHRDRTAEFRSLSQTLLEIGGIGAVSDHAQNGPLSKAPPPVPHKSEVNQRTARIVAGIQETSQEIVRLKKLGKWSSVFDDSSVEIQALTALIKNHIAVLDTALADLINFQNMEIAGGNCSEDSVAHSATVCNDLESKLTGATKHFRDVLTQEQKFNLKAHENRKQMFSKNVLRENPLQCQRGTVTKPPPWSNSSNAAGSLRPSGLPSNGVQVGNQLRRRPAADNTPSHYMEMSILQQVIPWQEKYIEGRAAALHTGQSTSSELSGISTHLATVVAQQGELVIRIDEDIDESLANVQGARNALMRHLNQISSSRWLLIKVFAMIILFLVVFFIFVA